MKTDRKTSPDTVFVPAEPIRVTLMSRPETPRLRRSSAVSVPTFVRASAANHADSWAVVYVAVAQVAKGAPASYGVPSGFRSLEPRR